MPDSRRYFVPGGSYFFTQVADERRPFLTSATARRILREKLLACKERWPFRIDAIVLLPDHWHSIWTLPPGDAGYPTRWGWLKKEFTKDWLQLGNKETEISDARRRERRRGVWQPRFWEHLLRDADDFENHMHYVHYNPVKHGLVSSPRDWPWSSFHRWVKAGLYDINWGSSSGPKLEFGGIEERAGE